MRFAKNDLAQRFAELTPRERVLALGGVLVVLMYGAYLLFYQPIAEQSRLLTLKIQAQQQIYTYLEQVGNEVAALRQQATVDAPALEGANQSPMAVVDFSSQQLEIKPAIKHLSPEGEDKVSVWLEHLAFDRLMSWLAILETKHRLQVLQIDVEKPADADGIVNAKVLLGVV
ncbi:type II secretion system protein M [Methylomonas sp. MO1]|uniref:type II secretion system protein M n=1 Tax=Methylomonas sp. MO1 TaxID=3073619 RepID=UPI0028A4CEC5|nr:type II secretion system protein M [Methylomonas sp. MO1]MDT4288356.1 type II secretion system protein M [Methylomonas sp. MO1]